MSLEVTKIYTTPKRYNTTIDKKRCLEVTKIYTTPKPKSGTLTACPCLEVTKIYTTPKLVQAVENGTIV